MDETYFDVFPSKDKKSLFAILGFEIPFLPDLISSDGFSLSFEQEHSHLLNQQIRFLRMFYPPSETDLVVNDIFGLPPEDTAALELRFVARNAESERKVEIFVLGRVNCAGSQDNTQKEPTDDIRNHTIKYADDLRQHIQQTFPLEYTLRPLLAEEWNHANPINLDNLTDPKCTAEICRYVESNNGEEDFAYPFLWSKNTFSQLCKLLKENSTTIVLSISIQPDAPLSDKEKDKLRRLSIDTAPTDIEGLNNDFTKQRFKSLRGAKASAANYYLRTLQKPLLLRIQVVSDTPIPEGLLQAIGEEISSTRDNGLDESFFGIWQPFQYCYPNQGTLEMALNNFKYVKRDIWNTENKNRLRYLVGATEANAAFRIPLVTPYGIPGLEIVPFNPFLSQRQSARNSADEDMIKLGSDIHGTDFNVSVSSLSRHALIVGSTGSGKTITCQTILAQLLERGDPPFLVIEPVKTEYRRIISSNEKGNSVLLFTLGDIVSPFQFNPFEIPVGVSLGSYISALKSCFIAAFPMNAYLSVILERIIRAAYKAEGWNDQNARVTGKEKSKFPTLNKLCDEISTFVKASGYSGQIKQDIEAALEQRFFNLRDSILGKILSPTPEVPLIWDWETLFSNPVIFELEKIVDDDEKSLLMALIFTTLSFHRKTDFQKNGESRKSKVKHITLIEEAHRLFSNSGLSKGDETVSTRAKNISIFTDMLAEMRALGEGILIAEQIPTKLASDIIKHPEMKIMHRITADEDRQILGSAMNFTENHRKYITTLKQGFAAVYVEGLYAPALVHIESAESKDKKNKSKSEILDFIIPTEDEIFDRMVLAGLSRSISKYKNDPKSLTAWLNAFRKQAIKFKVLSNSEFEFTVYFKERLTVLSHKSPNLAEICKNLSSLYDNVRNKE